MCVISGDHQALLTKERGWDQKQVGRFGSRPGFVTESAAALRSLFPFLGFGHLFYKVIGETGPRMANRFSLGCQLSPVCRGCPECQVKKDSEAVCHGVEGKYSREGLTWAGMGEWCLPGLGERGAAC